MPLLSALGQILGLISGFCSPVTSLLSLSHPEKKSPEVTLFALASQQVAFWDCL